MGMFRRDKPNDADTTAGTGDEAVFTTGRGTQVYDGMLLARRVRMVALAAFTVFVAWQQMWLLTGIGIALILMTLWQNKRLREEIAVRQADDERRSRKSGQ